MPDRTVTAETATRLAAAATPGPWAVYLEGQCCNGRCIEAGEPGSGQDVAHNLHSISPADEALILAAPDLATTAAQQAQLIAAVLALHQPRASDVKMAALDPDWRIDCEGCVAECAYCEGDHPYPCPTARALGVTE